MSEGDREEACDWEDRVYELEEELTNDGYQMDAQLLIAIELVSVILSGAASTSDQLNDLVEFAKRSIEEESRRLFESREEDQQ